MGDGESAWNPRPALRRPLVLCTDRAPARPTAEVLVLATYRAQQEGELSLAPGDVVRQVCPGPTRGWLRGELGGRSGLFPEGLVQVRPAAGGLEGRAAPCAPPRN